MKTRLLLLTFALAIAVAPLQAHLLTATDLAGNQVQIRTAGNVSVSVDSLAAPGVTAVAFGELISASPGGEFAIATGNVLTIYAQDMSTVLLQRDFSDAYATPVIKSLSIGNLRSDNTGAELAIGAHGTGGGLLLVVNPESGVLTETNLIYTGAMPDGVTAVCAADTVDTHPGDEINFVWEYAEGFQQVSVWGVQDWSYSYDVLRIYNVQGICRDEMKAGDFDNDGTLDLAIALDNGWLWVADPSLVDPNPALLSMQGYQGFGGGNALHVGVGELVAASPGDEIVLGTLAGQLRVIKVNGAFDHTEFAALDTASEVREVVVSQYGTGDIAVGSADGALTVYEVQDTALVSTDVATGLGVWADLKEVPNTVPVELSAFVVE